jgi:hypothetical protein
MTRRIFGKRSIANKSPIAQLRDRTAAGSAGILEVRIATPVEEGAATGDLARGHEDSRSVERTPDCVRLFRAAVNPSLDAAGKTSCFSRPDSSARNLVPASDGPMESPFEPRATSASGLCDHGDGLRYRRYRRQTPPGQRPPSRLAASAFFDVLSDPPGFFEVRIAGWR